MASDLVRFCFIILSWNIKVILTSDRFSAENNSSELYSSASGIVFDRYFTEKNNWKFHNSGSDVVSTEKSVEKSSSVMSLQAADFGFTENLVSPEILALTSGTVSTDNLDKNNSSESYDYYMSGKDESLFECDLWELESGEFTIFPNGSAFVPLYNQTYEEPFYIFFDNLLRVCPPQKPTDDEVETLTKSQISYLALIGVITSMVCLSLHLIVFLFVPDLQNLPGCNLSSLCASLLLTNLFMLIGHYREDHNHPNTCMIAGILTYFFFLASFLWMFVIAFDICRSIVLATGKMRAPRKEFKVKKFVWYNLFSWFTSLVFTVAAVFADNLESVPHNFRPMFRESCWFRNQTSLLTFFIVPLAVLVCLNFLMFGISAFKTFSARMKSRCESQAPSRNHLVYFRLSVIMGVTWITGVVAPVVNVLWLWYVFAVLNTLQGLFIFLAFTCSTKVIKFIKERMFKARRPSQQTLPPTFQSYGFCTGTVESDVDKVSDSIEQSQSTDNIVIHL